MGSFLPSISSKLPADLRQFLARIKEFIDGNQFVTRRELLTAGVATEDDYGNLLPGDAELASRAVPPAPTNVTAAGAMTNILIGFDAPPYGNHAHAEVWAAETDLLSAAVLIGTTPGTLFAHALGPGSTRYYWVRFVSKANVIGPWNATAGTLGQTSQDPAWLLEVLTNQLTTDQLAIALNTRIDQIDISANGILGGLVKLTELQTGQLNALQANLDTASNSLLDTLLHVQGIEDKLTDAGIVVNPDTGQVYIYGLEEYKTATDARLSSAEVRLDGHDASINLKASVAYVDQAIAEAVFDPSQIADLSNLYARMTAAEVDIDGAEAAIALKASLVEVNGIDSRVTVAEGEIDVLQGQIALKADTTTVTDLDARLDTAETTLSTMNGAEITNTVTSIRRLNQQSQADGYALLNGLLHFNDELTQPAGAVAMAKQELRSYTDNASSAEAAARLELQAQVNDATTGLAAAHAAVVEEKSARVSGDEANAASINALSAQVNNATTGLPATYAAVLAEASTRATADSANAASISTLAAQINDATTGLDAAHAAILTEQSARVSGDSANAASISAVAGTVSTLQTTVDGHTALISTQASSIDGMQAIYTVKIDNNGYLSGFGLMSDIADGGAPVSRFIASVDQFAVAAPTTSLLARANGTAYSVGQVRTAPGSTSMMLVCKAAGTSGMSAPTVTWNIGALVSDGGVVWQVASRVPFAVMTSAMTIDGTSVPAGVYLDGAFIHNASINSLQVGGITADKILSAVVNGVNIIGQNLYGGIFEAGGTYSLNANGSVTATNSKFKVSAGVVDVLYSAFRITQTAGGAATTPFYVAGGNTYISSAYIENATITNAKIQDAAVSLAKIDTATIADLSALSATIGVLRTATSGARMEIRDNVIKVYDASGVVRVQLGNLAL